MHRLAGDAARGQVLIFGAFLEIPERCDDTSALRICKQLKNLPWASLKVGLKYLVCLRAKEREYGKREV